MKKYREFQQRGTEHFPFSYYKEKYSNYMIKLHWHPEIELLYGISGEVCVTVAEEKHILKAGDILFINPEELHSYHPLTQMVEYHAAVFSTSLFQFKDDHFFELEFINPLSNGLLKFPRLVDQKHSKYFFIEPIVYKLFNEDINSKSMVFADLTLLFCTLLEHSLLEKNVDEATHKKSEDVKLCLRYMEQNYARKITLQELASLVHMTPHYFCKYFKEHTNVTPITQLNYIRIKNATKLLHNSEYSIELVAEKCGFNNTNFFTRKFKSIMNCTPSSYRKKIFKGN